MTDRVEDTITQQDALTAVKRAQSRLVKARDSESEIVSAFHDAITDAVDSGLSLRTVGKVAGLSGMRVSQIHRQTKAARQVEA